MCQRNFIYDNDEFEDEDPSGEYLDYGAVEEDYSLSQDDNDMRTPAKNVKKLPPYVK